MAMRRRPPPLVIAAMTVLGGVLLVSAFAEFIAPYPYTRQFPGQRLLPPFWLGGPPEFFLGTDEIGRDLFSRLVHGTRISLLIAILGTLIGAVLGTSLGFAAAHFRGYVEEAVMMLVDVQASLPFMIVVLATLALFGNSLLLFLALIGVAGWETYARLARGLVLAEKEKGYYAAIRAAGSRPGRLYVRHVLPNVMSVLIVAMTLNFPQTILLETSLSFLGLGVQPPLPSLGLILGQGRQHMLLAWWLPVLPGVMIFVTTLAASILGDWLRDRFDPTIR